MIELICDSTIENEICRGVIEEKLINFSKTCIEYGSEHRMAQLEHSNLMGVLEALLITRNIKGSEFQDCCILILEIMSMYKSLN